jgi:hypothetical protein
VLPGTTRLSIVERTEWLASMISRFSKVPELRHLYRPQRRASRCFPIPRDIVLSIDPHIPHHA